MQRTALFLAFIALASAISACGGGSNSVPQHAAAPPNVPNVASSTASPVVTATPTPTASVPISAAPSVAPSTVSYTPNQPTSPRPIPTQSTSPLKVVQYSMPSLIGGITLGPDGNLWYTFVAGTVGNINANTGVVTTFNGVTSTEENCTMGLPNTDRPSAGPVHLGIILTGPDGQLWFGAQCGIPLTAGLSGFNQITTSGALSGNLSEYYNAPEIVDATVTPSGVWATMLGLGNDDGVAVFDPTSALPAQFNCTSPPPFLGSIMGGPDGAVWATANDPTTQPQQHLFVRLSPSCQLTVVATQTSSTYSGVASAAGSVWTLKTPNSIAKFSMSGTETDFVISNPLGPDGGSIQASSFEPQYIYFDDADNGRVGRMNVGTGKVEEFAIPNGGTVFHPMDMAIDASGNIWTHDLQTILKITFPN